MAARLKNVVELHVVWALVEHFEDTVVQTLHAHGIVDIRQSNRPKFRLSAPGTIQQDCDGGSLNDCVLRSVCAKAF